ncbi:MAG: hypothetical protein KGR25_10475 [Chloroflexi bacterium]|nr:hypothetical protein [Chloroflexota bacterium]
MSARSTGREPVRLSDALNEYLTDLGLYWHEPDSGCVSCGNPYLTIADHRCGDCTDQPVSHCPHCLGDIAGVVDRDLARRLRQMSWDISEEFRARNLARRLDEARRALAYRHSRQAST